MYDNAMAANALNN